MITLSGVQKRTYDSFCFFYFVFFVHLFCLLCLSTGCKNVFISFYKKLQDKWRVLWCIYKVSGGRKTSNMVGWLSKQNDTLQHCKQPWQAHIFFLIDKKKFPAFCDFFAQMASGYLWFLMFWSWVLFGTVFSLSLLARYLSGCPRPRVPSPISLVYWDPSAPHAFHLSFSTFAFLLFSYFFFYSSVFHC